MTLLELRSWCNRASFCDDKEVIFITPDGQELAIDTIEVRRSQIVLR